MRALLYDIHANLPALEAVLAEAEGAGAKSFVLGGDYAFAGAFPSETVSRLRELDALWIRGNGERWTRDPADAPDQPFVQRALEHCRAELGERLVAELAALPERAELDDLLFCHGSPRSDVETFGPEPADTDSELLAGVELPVVVFGHSHVQFARRSGERVLVNPGSIGMPFDGDPRAAYALWDGGTAIELRRAQYDSRQYLEAVRERLAPSLGDTVGTLVRRIESAAFVD